MANEATLYKEHFGETRSYQVADATAIAKGTLLVISADSAGDNPTVVAHSAGGQYPVGFAVQEKEANDGQTRMGVQREGIVDAVADQAIVLGDFVVVGSVANTVRRMPVITFSATHLNEVVGRCLETASNAEKVRIALMLP